MESKDLKRVLATIHNEVQYDPVVSEEHRTWIFRNSLDAFLGLCKSPVYRVTHDDIQCFFWERYWDGWGEKYQTCQFGVDNDISKKYDTGPTRYWVSYGSFRTTFLSTEVLHRESRRELVDRGVPFTLIKYIRRLFIQWWP